MDESKAGRREKTGPGAAAYALGYSSFIPLLGLLTGFLSILWGLATVRRKGWHLVLLGMGGWLFTAWIGFEVYDWLYLDTTGYAARAWVNSTQIQLDKLVTAIEKYKSDHGEYPSQLWSLKRELGSKNLIISDLIAVRAKMPDIFRNPKKMEIPLYFYQVNESSGTYYLFSRGFDGMSFTPDDIFPDVPADGGGTYGYRQRPDSPLGTLAP